MFQTQVLNGFKVKVYKVRIYDVATDELRISRRMATQAGADKMRGETIPGTEVLTTSDQLERGEEWTERDFEPSAAGDVGTVVELP